MRNTLRKLKFTNALITIGIIAIIILALSHVSILHHGAEQWVAKTWGTGYGDFVTILVIIASAFGTLSLLSLKEAVSERKRAEEESKKLARHNELLLFSVGEGVLGFDLDGNHTFVNPAATSMLGYEASELLGKPCHSVWHHTKADGSLYPEHECPIYAVLESGRITKRRDEVFWKKDGTRFDVAYIATPVVEVGKICGVVVTFRDITERRLNEERLEAILALNKMADAPLGEIMGFALEEAIKLTRSSVGYLGFLDEREEILQDFLASRSASKECGPANSKVHSDLENAGLWGVAVRNRTPLIVNDHKAESPSKDKFPSGHISLERHMHIPIFDGERIIILAGVGNKIADYDQADVRQIKLLMKGLWRIVKQKRAEAKLLMSEERYRSFVQNFQGIAYRFLPDFTPRFLHGAVEDITGYTEKEFLDGHIRWNRIVHPDDLGKTSEHREKISTVPGYSFECEYRILRKNGEIKWVYEMARNFCDTLNIPMRINGAVYDVSRRKKAEEQAQIRVDRLAALRDIDRAMTSNFDLDLTLKVVLEEAMKQLGVDAADILLFKPAFQILEFAAARGFRTKIPQHTQLRLGRGHAGRAAMERRTIHVPDLSVDRGDVARDSLFEKEGFVSYRAAPLINKGRIKGVLEIFHRSSLDPDQEWIDFLDSLAAQAAIAVDYAELFYSLQQSNSDLIMAYDATIEGWAQALDYRDEETEGHSRRVTEMTVRIGKAMGINDSDLVHVRRGALLHDIGKMGMPDSILLKPGELTGEERDFMQKHTVYAYELLSRIDFLRQALDIPYCHHEKWDGTGYPRGLKGEQIPLSARVFAVVDVWDALGSDRPYRPAWTKERALEYIRQRSGTDFDPKVTEAFEKVLSEDASF